MRRGREAPRPPSTSPGRLAGSGSWAPTGSGWNSATARVSPCPPATTARPISSPAEASTSRWDRRRQSGWKLADRPSFPTAGRISLRQDGGGVCEQIRYFEEVHEIDIPPTLRIMGPGAGLSALVLTAQLHLDWPAELPRPKSLPQVLLGTRSYRTDRTAAESAARALENTASRPGGSLCLTRFAELLLAREMRDVLISQPSADRFAGRGVHSCRQGARCGAHEAGPCLERREAGPPCRHVAIDIRRRLQGRLRYRDRWRWSPPSAWRLPHD